MPAPFPERWRELKQLLDADRPPVDMSLYVPPRRSCAEEIAAELNEDAGLQKFLLIGPRGGGKSTELREIRRGLGQDLVVAEVDLDRSGVSAGSISAADLCYLGATAFLRFLPDGKHARQLFEALKAAYAENEGDASSLGTLAEALEGLASFASGASAAAVLAGGVAGMGPMAAGLLGVAGTGVRLFTRRGMAIPETSPLGRGLQARLQEIAQAVRVANNGKPLCLLVDGLEKMNGEAGERFREIFQRTRLLTDAPWSAVLAAPPCTLTETFSADGQGWSERVVWGFGPDDLGGLINVLQQRFQRAGLEVGREVDASALQKWVTASGGMPRHAIEMAHRAVELARRSGGDRITSEMVEDAIRWKAESLGRGMDMGHIEVLARVERTGALPKDPQAASLFSDGRILALPPDGRKRIPRFIVHPLLEEDARELAHKLESETP